jgi:Lon protease-like protein
MFPLGTVLFPHALLPLHVFEPRYREMTEQALAGIPEFGVVLIERGSEVGGGDSRFAVGTVARILEAGRLADGRYVLTTVGTHRLRIESWLGEQPYPHADVVLVEEMPPPPDAAAARDAVEERLREVAALVGRAGGQPPPDELSLDADPGRASFEGAALAPIGPLDAQRLLEIDDPLDRLETLDRLLADELEVLRRLGDE